MKRKTLYIVSIVLTLTACGTKKAIVNNTKKNTPQLSIVEQVRQHEPRFSSAKVDRMILEITYNGHQLKVNASSSILSDSLMLISLQPVMGIELFRAEIDQQNVRIIDKMNRRYVDISFNELKQQTGVVFSLTNIQDLLLGRMFVMGEDSTYLLRAPIQVTENQDNAILVVAKPQLTYSFDINKLNYTLSSTLLSVSNGMAQLQVDYKLYDQSNDIIYPSLIAFRPQMGDMQTECTAQILNATFNTPLSIKRMDTKRYTQTTLQQLLKGL